MLDIVFTLPLLILSAEGGKDDTSAATAAGEVVEGEGKKDVPYSLPVSHQHDQ